MAPRDRSSRSARRWEIGGSAVLLVVVGLGIGLCLYQRQLDFALIDAAAKRDVQAGLHALAAGANPNARGVPGEKNGPHLFALPNLPAKTDMKGSAFSALTLAEDHREEELVLDLLRRGAVPNGPEQYTPAEVESLLRKYPARWLREGDLDEDDYYINDENSNLCRRVLARFPVCGRAELALGEALVLAGEYREAREVLQRAANHLPNDPRTTIALRLADQRVSVATTIQRLLPRPLRVLHLRRLPTRTGVSSRWAALVGEIEIIDELLSRSDLRLSLWREEAGTLQSYAEIALGDAADGDVTFQLRDVTGDGIPEAAVMTALPGAGWSESCLWIFSCEPDRLVRKLELGSNARLWMRDLDRDGRPEIFTTHEIGVELPHVGQPRWIDVYRWKNGRYVVADRDFPLAYRDLDQEIGAALRDVPHDWQLWKYRGIIRTIQRRRSEARSALRKALELLTEQPESAAEVRAVQEKELREIRDRLTALGRRGKRGRRNRRQGRNSETG